MIRPARIPDVVHIAQLVNPYAQRDLMLPLPWNKVYENLRDFVVAEEDGAIVGCGALHVLWHDLAEVRSIAVREDRMGRGYGRAMVEALMEDARRLGIHRVFMLILPDGPMARLAAKLGFGEVGKEALPHKVWSDCLNCPRFANCDEIAVVAEMGPNLDAPVQWESVIGAYTQPGATRCRPTTTPPDIPLND